jgi:hypothetical protein
MCDSPQSLKLCTCSAQIDLSRESHWILGGEQSDKEPVTRVLGTIAIRDPEEFSSSGSYRSHVARVAQSFERLSWGHLAIDAEEFERLLNRSNCFDFELKPKRGMLLTLKFAAMTGFDCIQFEFKIKKWKAIHAWVESPEEASQVGCKSTDHGPIEVGFRQP